MCTAATYQTRDFYFGRTLDHDFSYGQAVTITPRNFPLPFRSMPTMTSHYAIIGMAHTAQGYPLYFDGVNEKGLCMAGLNFVGYASYRKPMAGRDNITHFELIPWILGRCADVSEAKTLIKRLNLTDIPFSPELPPARLHWLIADKTEAITLESTRDGLRVFHNPVGILTNNPPFDQQMFHLNNFMHLSARPPRNCFSENLPLHAYSRGMGALGLPGDLSSQSRFVRAAFAKMNAVSGPSEGESVSQFFHILGTVDQPRGCCQVDDGVYEITMYTSCCNATQGIYYYTTYENHQITAVHLHREDLEGHQLVRYPLVTVQQIYKQN